MELEFWARPYGRIFAWGRDILHNILDRLVPKARSFDITYFIRCIDFLIISMPLFRMNEEKSLDQKTVLNMLVMYMHARIDIPFDLTI